MPPHGINGRLLVRPLHNFFGLEAGMTVLTVRERGGENVVVSENNSLRNQSGASKK